MNCHILYCVNRFSLNCYNFLHLQKTILESRVTKARSDKASGQHLPNPNPPLTPCETGPTPSPDVASPHQKHEVSDSESNGDCIIIPPSPLHQRKKSHFRLTKKKTEDTDCKSVVSDSESCGDDILITPSPQDVASPPLSPDVARPQPPTDEVRPSPSDVVVLDYKRPEVSQVSSQNYTLYYFALQLATIHSVKCSIFQPSSANCI